MMNYLEESTRLLRVVSEGGSEEDAGPSAEQVVATRAVASALVALVERLGATAKDGVDREVDILSAVDARLKSGENRIGHIDKRSVLAGESIDALWKRFELSETDYISLRGRLDELERKLGEIGHFSISERLADVERRADELESFPGAPDDATQARRLCDACGGDGRVEVPAETQSALREQLAEVMRQSKDLPVAHPCYLTVGLYGEEIVSQEITLGDLRNVILAMNIKSGGAEAQWEKLEGANADIERHQRQLALRDKQVREFEGKVSKILEIVNDGEISFNDMRIEIIRATY